MIKNDSHSTLVAYPNPSSGQVTFSYILPQSSTNARLVVHDICGKILANREINGSSGTFVWQTSEVANGIYLYELLDEKVFYNNGKIIIIH